MPSNSKKRDMTGCGNRRRRRKGYLNGASRIMTNIAERSHKDYFLSELKKPGSGRVPVWVRDIRHRGVARVEGMDMPHRKQEAWRFTDIESILQTPFQFHAGRKGHGLGPSQIRAFLFGTATCGELVFVDGVFASDLSNLLDLPKGLAATNLFRGITDYSRVVKAHLDKYLGDGDAFAALNSALLHDGAYVHVRQNVVVDRPIHLVFVSTGHDENRGICPRNLIVIEQGSRAGIIESYVNLGGGGGYLNAAVTECVMDENAQVDFCKVVDEGPLGCHLGTFQVTQRASSVFRSHVVTLGGKIVRNAQTVALDGDGAECSLNGLYLNEGERLIDNALMVDHAKPHCMSRIAYKGVLDGTSKSVFTGSVVVRKHAQKTDSNQINSNLLLSDQAQINTKPQLRIYADDVKCTHGATVGPPPEEMIFYFKTRAIDEAAAVNMMTCGFARDVTKGITTEALRDRLDTSILRKYSSMGATQGE